MRYHIEEAGQAYEPGKDPVKFVKSEEDTSQVPEGGTEDTSDGLSGIVQDEESSSSEAETQPEVIPEAPEASPFDDVFDAGDTTPFESQEAGLFTDF